MTEREKERERLIEILKEGCKPNIETDYDDHSCWVHYGNIADHLLSNGVIVPPCKVGDTVYAVTLETKTFTYGIHRGYVGSINICSSKIYIAICHEGFDDEPYFDKIIGRFDDFGKTVFLTKEEAEKALKKRSEGK